MWGTMIVRLKPEIFKYFRNSTNLTVKVIEMNNYYRLNRFVDVELKIDDDSVSISD
jgi:hypothetical protein